MVAEVLLPLLGRGLLRRRPGVVAALERGDADRRAVEWLRSLRERYGPGPIRLRLPAREVAIVLDPSDVPHVLAGDPEPFAPATQEKRSALHHFQPGGVLASTGRERVERRRFNEAVLEPGSRRPSVADHVERVVGEETDALIALTDRVGVLSWDDLLPAWYRIVRRIVLGDVARDDHQLTDDLAAPRDRANLSFLAPRDRGTRARFLRRLEAHLAEAEPGSLAERVATQPDGPATDPARQVPQWLFAFEPAGMAAHGALALVAAHPGVARAHLDDDRDGSSAGRGLVLESLRLWPTTPAILRETTERTTWRGARLPEGTSLLIHAPLFHRDEHLVPGADEFRPTRWNVTPELPDASRPLVPFSGGPGACPGRDLVLLTTSAFLERFLAVRWPQLDDPGRLPAGRPLPGVLDPHTLRFTTVRR